MVGGDLSPDKEPLNRDRGGGGGATTAALSLHSTSPAAAVK
jgi:hypothetical protein